jgi:hypothetical protein
MPPKEGVQRIGGSPAPLQLNPNAYVGTGVTALLADLSPHAAVRGSSWMALEIVERACRATKLD